MFEKGKIKNENSSGKVRFQDNFVFWDYQDKNILQINADDIVVIGEYTNSDGPLVDDWFLTFVTRNGQWQSISRYADNIDKVLQFLSSKFQSELETTLTNSAQWKSVIMFPLSLKGKPLFKLINLA